MNSNIAIISLSVTACLLFSGTASARTNRAAPDFNKGEHGGKDFEKKAHPTLSDLGSRQERGANGAGAAGRDSNGASSFSSTDRGRSGGRDGGRQPRCNLKEMLARFKDGIDPAVKAAAQAVVTDLQAIKEGGYITSTDVDAIKSAIRDAIADKSVTPEEKAALQALVQQTAQKIPVELTTQLKADLDALSALLQEA